MIFFTEWLAHPQALWLLLGLPMLAGLALWARFARHRGWRLFGGVRPSPTRRWLHGLLVAGGLMLVGVAAAGPHWGRDQAAIAGTARDLVVVLDVSRSMLAETPSRQLRAQRVLADLATTLKQRGGHRIALVASAAKAQLIVPLTNDYDLFLEAVLRQDAANLPTELRPGKDGPFSGTRLGQGLREAVEAHVADPLYRGSQVILLISDGDDPAGDGEWKDGAAAAHKAAMPVYVIGVGDPTKPTKIRLVDKLLAFGDQPVETILNEEVLKEIAQRTDGVYFPVRTQNVVPGTLFSSILEAASARPRESILTDDFHQRFRWFLAPGLLLLGASLVVSDGRRAAKRSTEQTMSDNNLLSGMSLRPAPLAAAAALAMLAVLLVGATPAEVDDLIRLGTDAFQKKDYPLALKFFEQAEERAEDPGLIAFNKGVTLFRLGRLREAELCYLRCLQDRAAPADRRLKALYDLGTVLLQRGWESKDLDALLRAQVSFKLCYKESNANKLLRDDAEHNIELAHLLWQKVRADIKAANGNKDPENPPKSDSIKPTTDPLIGSEPGPLDPLQGSGAKPQPGDKKAAPTDQVMPGAGNIKTLPDTAELEPLDAADARELLARVIRRIEGEQTRPAGLGDEIPGVKDW
ncbi:MAG TPA: VWA domain-containing protein [Gemmataceae bacterium]|nr:VWA domain-containing protein [Gemmataceae bacterium]